MLKQDKLIANPQVVFREEFDDWVIVFEPDQGAALGLNPMGAFMWKLFDGTHSAADILNTVREHFDDVPDDAPDHLAAFLEELVRRGFVGYVVEEV